MPELPAKTDFPVVGVGASAGGLEAFTQLLTALPAETGMAFILVQHLDPEHASALTTILGRATKMPVREATQRMQVRPNEVYVIPPNASMSLSRGRLELKPREQTRSPHLSIDHFFQSLSREKKEGAIGIVFSGNATDGTNGLEAIKAGGGITFAQDKSARYDSMPRHAIDSGCVDFVMSPAAIAKELTRIAGHPYLRGVLPPLPADAVGDPAEADPAAGDPTTPPSRAHPSPARGFARILELAREQSGVDFTLYKTSTLHRRITRRMVLSHRNSLDDYASFAAADPAELKALHADLLISVTSFFRDEAAFDVIRHAVFPSLIKSANGAIRIWTIGCSSGQEAYSLAMTYLETIEAHPSQAPKLQIFGTDLNEALLLKARHGLYPKSVAQQISPERLRKFFVEEDGGYRVIKALREVCIFARQDLMRDPPFSRMDLVSCRNVLIYIEDTAQQRIMRMLHYSLKPGGFLFLGLSESAGAAGELFEPREKKQKIFSRRARPTPAFSIPRRDRHPPDGRISDSARPRLAEEELRTELHAHQEADRIMVNLFAPPGVLVDASLNVLQFRGATEAFLTPASGKASLHLLKLARENLLLPLRSAINRARRLNEPVRREKVRIGKNKSDTVSLRIIPLKNLRERYFLVLFETPDERAAERPPPEPLSQPGKNSARRDQSRIAELERELRETRDYLQSLQQQHDTAHDELQASNEEVQSTNEELQSINEELETSKEELESGNEELVTVNEEMTHRNTELNRLNSDLSNFHVSINTPIVVLAHDLTIRRFTPPAEKLFNLLATDIGRPFAGIRHNLQLDDLEHLIGQVINQASVREAEIQTREGHWYLLRARPYLNVNNQVDGAVLVLLDIDDLKRTQLALQTSESYFRELTENLPCGIWTSEPDGRVDFINRYWLNYTGQTFGHALTHPEVWAKALHPEDRPRAQEISAAARAAGKGYTFEARFQQSNGGDYRWFLKRSVPIHDGAGNLLKRIGILTDIDDLKRAQTILSNHAGELEVQVLSRTQELRETNTELEAFSYSVSHDMRAPLRAMQGFALLLLKTNETLLDAESLDQLRRINASAGRMDLLISDVLTYSRLLRSEIVLQPIKLDALVPIVIATYPQLHAPGVKISIEGGLPVVLANDASLIQCLSNLLSNAVKFVSPGVSPNVRLRADDAEGDARLWIEDNGIGIDPKNHARIWEIFTRIERARDYDGTGIGLAIVRKAVERMNGTVGLESALGQGSRFWIRLRRG